MHVLLIEDEDSIAEPLADGLRRDGFEVTRAASGEHALDLSVETVDVVLLDLRLPGMDGFDVCRRLREKSNLPIIMTTARGEEIDKVLGLELGADDYVVKPFGVRELIARIHAVTRRTRGAVGASSAEQSQFSVGELLIDLRAHRASLAGQSLDLTPTEFALLRVLAKSPGEALSRKYLLREVWNTSWTSSGKTVDVHIAALRRKLGSVDWIDTVRGIGYRLVDRS